MNQYFNTGKTIVIDDQYTDAKPLLDVLCKKHIPFVYTQGKPNSEYPLPNKEQYYNLIFLDLNLDFKFASGVIGNEGDEKTFKGIHSTILDTILKNENRSFIIVIWSNEEENYLEHYKAIFDDNSNYTKKRPYKIISLSKSDYFNLTEKGYIFKTDDSGNPKKFEDQLFSEIDQALKDMDAFKLFCEWDRVVSLSASDTIDDVMSMINKFEDEVEREEHLTKILTCLSVSYSGDKRYLALTSDQEKTDAVLHTLTQILNDDLDRNIYLKKQQEFKKWSPLADKKEIGELKNSINSSLLNSKLLIYKPNKTDLTGSVYNITNDLQSHLEIFKEIINIDSKNSKKCITDSYALENKDKQHQNPEELHKQIEKYVYERILPIEINVTPACDIANDKAPIHRIVSGFIIPYFFCKSFDLSPDYLIKSPCFYNDLFEKDYLKSSIIILDLRYLKSDIKNNILKKAYLFSLRTNLVNDIQTKLASHVSRLGVLSV